MAFFDKFKSAIGLEDDYDYDDEWDDEWDDEDYEYSDDEYYDEYEEEPAGRLESPGYSSRRREEGTTMGVGITQSTYGKMQITIHEPITYDDAPRVLNDVKAKKIVLLNFESLEAEKKKQVFEFVNGGIYSLEAQIQKVTKDIFVIAPKGIIIEGRVGNTFADPSGYSSFQQD